MEIQLHRVKIAINTIALFCAIFMLSISALKAQSTINTLNTFTPTDSVAVVTFNFQNTNSYPVIITGVSGLLSYYGDHNIEFWYKNTALIGAPGLLNAANGWTLLNSSTAIGIEHLNNGNELIPLMQSLQLNIPANSTYSIAITAVSSVANSGSLQVANNSTVQTISQAGCNIITSNTIGYGGFTASSPDLAGKAFVGSIQFKSAAPCTGLPVAAVVSGPTNVCANSLFMLSASNAAEGGINHQWQRYNTTTNSWDNIPGATDVHYAMQLGIATSTQYRYQSTCINGSGTSNSNTITVNINNNPVSGTYTINDKAPSSATNFRTFETAMNFLKCGISGPVTFNVDPQSGPYTEQVFINNITGSSATNIIRIKGNGRFVQYHQTTSTEYYLGVVTLTGARYVVIDSLNVRTLNPVYGTGYSLVDSSRKDSIKNCFIDVQSVGSYNNIGNSGNAGINLSYTYNAQYNRATAACYVGHNHILGSNKNGGVYYGINDGNYYYANNYIVDSGNVIVKNEIENFFYMGISTSGRDGTIIAYNDIHRKNKIYNNNNNFNFYGIYYYNYNNSNNNISNDTSIVKIIGNRIHHAGSNNNGTAYSRVGIYLNGNNNYYNNNFVSDVLVANNVIYEMQDDQNINSSTNCFGIQYYNGLNNSNNTDRSIFKIYHNTIHLKTKQSTSSYGTVGIFGQHYNNTNFTYYDTSLIKNNLITIDNTQPGNAYGFYHYNINSSLPNFANYFHERNIVYYYNPQAANQYYCFNFGTAYATLPSFQTAFPNQEQGSITANPQYFDILNANFMPTNTVIFNNGVNLLVDVPTDIAGRARTLTPTPGAYQNGADAGVTALIAPVGTYCSSEKTVIVSIKNHGLIPINNVQLGWSMNGVAQTPVNFLSTLNPGATANVSLGIGLFLPNTPVTIKAWTFLPNNTVDYMLTNDTMIAVTQCSSSIPVDIGPRFDTICVGNSKTYDAGYPAWQHKWDNAATTQLRSVSQAGTYYVRVSGLDGCLGFDTVTLALRALPIIDLGPNFEFCWGETHVLDATYPNAQAYNWSTGSTSAQITIDTSGYYEVAVKDQYGCIGRDSIIVGLKDIPWASGINATHADSGTYTFFPINPQYASNYWWNFGDGSPIEYGYMVQHTYTQLGIFTVTLYLEGECTGLVIDKSKTVDVFVVRNGSTGLNDQHKDYTLSLYPNPTQEVLNINLSAGVLLNSLKVYNVLGQQINAINQIDKQQYQLSTLSLANGIYTIQLETAKEKIVRKFEVMR
jgi:hypothetical protein